MFTLINKIYFLIFLFLFLNSCSTRYIEKKNIAEPNSSINNPLQSNVYFNISKDFKKNIPNCIVILPTKLSINNINGLPGKNLNNFDKILRKSIYAHLSTYNYRDIELNRIDYLIKEYNYNNLDDFFLLAKRLKCNSIFEIELNKFNYTYLGIYSSVNIAINLNLISLATNEIIWSSNLRELKAKGSFPLSPISIASGLYSATNNLKEESIFAIADNVSRKLLKKFPDRELDLIKKKLEVNSINKLHQDIKKFDKIIIDNINNLQFQKYILNNEFNIDKFKKAHNSLKKNEYVNEKSTYMYSKLLFKNGYYENAIEVISEFDSLYKTNDDLSFLKGKIYYNMNKYTEAEKNFIKAISKRPKSLPYYNALGVLYIKQNKISSANAVFTKALKNAPNDLKANKIMGVINLNLKKYKDAVYYFTNSAITSYENNDYRNLADNIILLEKIKKKYPDLVNDNIMKKLYFALERRN